MFTKLFRAGSIKFKLYSEIILRSILAAWSLHVNITNEHPGLFEGRGKIGPNHSNFSTLFRFTKLRFSANKNFNHDKKLFLLLFLSIFIN